MAGRDEDPYPTHAWLCDEERMGNVTLD